MAPSLFTVRVFRHLVYSHMTESVSLFPVTCRFLLISFGFW